MPESHEEWRAFIAEAIEQEREQLRAQRLEGAERAGGWGVACTDAARDNAAAEVAAAQDAAETRPVAVGDTVAPPRTRTACDICGARTYMDECVQTGRWANVCRACARECHHCGAVMTRWEGASWRGQHHCDVCARPCAECGAAVFIADGEGEDAVRLESGAWIHRGCSATCANCGDVYGDTETRDCGGETLCAYCYRDDWVEDEDGDMIERASAYECVSQDGYVLYRRTLPQNHRWCDDCERYESPRYRCSRRPTVIFPYHGGPHGSPLADAWTRANRRRFFGVELEVEVQGTHDREAIATRLLTAASGIELGQREDTAPLHFETDGSLSHGFEIITWPLSLPAHRTLWPSLMTRANVRGLRSHDVETCGIHIHITRASLSRLQIAKLSKFLNDPENRRLVECIARRYANSSYCEMSPKGSLRRRGDVCKALYGEHGHYDALNVSGTRTVEMRIFKGSLRPDAIVAAVEFAHAACEYCTDRSGAGLALTTAEFVAFIARPDMMSETRILRRYLCGRGFVELAASLPRVDRRIA